MKIRRKDTGITLIELLLVVVVIGVLVGVLMTVINKQRPLSASRDAVFLSRLEAISEVIESYGIVNRQFPSTCTAGIGNCSLLVPSYLKQLILDDLFSNGLVYTSDATGTFFRVTIPNSLGTFYVYDSRWDGRVMDCPNVGSALGACTSFH
jgi:type II secretory pathway pseudopilin PulG